MKTLFLSLLAAVAILPSLVADDGGIHIKPIFEIRNNRIIKVDGEWREDSPNRIKVTLRVDADTPAADITLTGYFFDGEGKLLATYDGPTPTYENVRGELKEVGLPETLSKNKDVEVLFAITPDLEKEWKSFVAVASKSGKIVARSRPAPAVDDVSFPERDEAELIRN